MSNLTKLKFVALNFLSWIHDTKIYLEAMNLDEIYIDVINPEDIIMDGNRVPQKDRSKVITFICYYLHKN